MIIKIKRIKKQWNIEIYNNTTLVKAHSLIDLNSFTISENDKINYDDKHVIMLDYSCYIIYRKTYPKIEKKAIISDSLKNIEKLYNKSFVLLDKYIIKNNDQRVFIGVLVKENLANFINLKFKKAKVEHFVKWSMDKSLTKYENYIFIKEKQLCLVHNNILIYKNEFCDKSINEITRDIACILFNLLYKGAMYLIYCANLKDVHYFMTTLKAKLEKQVLLIEQKLS